MTNLDYEELRRIYRLEKNTTRLVEVPEDFFPTLHDFIEDERKKYLDSLRDLNATKAKDFGNLKKLVEEWFSVREKKLLNTVLLSARTNDPDDSHMARPEKELYQALLVALQEHRSLVNQVLEANGFVYTPKPGSARFKNESDIPHPAPKIQSPASLSPKKDEIISSLPENKKKEGTPILPKRRITILAEVPSFVGTDMKEYGPYKQGESVELPQKIADLFVSRQLGE
ncbi:MAG: hypothetical protein Q8P05_05580 [Candidatus Diapherotrites archaeon]|nr:hypothetical protein [Candidatus Diapherotrites archaeon]MDZ4256705.1 hypothetical protein [archaeon]